MKSESALSSLACAINRFGEEWRSVKDRPSLADRLQKFTIEVQPLLHAQIVEPRQATRLQPHSLQLICAELQLALSASRGEIPGFNVWTLAGLQRDEVRTTGALAAFLNPALSGESAKHFLAALLEHSGLLVGESGFDLSGHYAVHTEHYFPGDKTTRMDIVIEGRMFLLTIEVKIDAPEGRSALLSGDDENISIEMPNHLINNEKQFERIMKRTNKLAEQRRLSPSSWAVIILSRRKLLDIGLANQISWLGVARAIRQLKAGRHVYTFHDNLLFAFGQHVKNLRRK